MPHGTLIGEYSTLRWANLLMRVGAFQRSSIFDDPGRVIQGIARDALLADERGIDLVLFPEAYLQGHAYDRSLIEKRAVTLDGPVVALLVKCVSSIKAVLIVGLFERRGTRILNSAGLAAGITLSALSRRLAVSSFLRRPPTRPPPGPQPGPRTSALGSFYSNGRAKVGKKCFPEFEGIYV